MRQLLFNRDCRGVSSVIGTILLVAVTVILVSVLSVFVFGVDLTGPACNSGLPAQVQSVFDSVCP